MLLTVVVNSTSNLAGILSVITWMVTKALLQDRCAVFVEVVQLTSQPLVKLKENLATLDNKNVQKASFAEMLKTPLATMCQCAQQKRQSHKVNLEYGALKTAPKEHGLLMM